MIPQRRYIFCIVVHFGSKSSTDTLIRDLLAQESPVQRIFVVDHADESYAPLSGAERVEVIRPKANKGYAAGVNVGLRAVKKYGAAPEDIVVCCNNDVRMASKVTTRIVRAAQQWRVPTLACARMGYVNLFTGRAHIGRAPRMPSLLYAHGSVLIASTATWEAVGHVPEKFFLYWEDVALSLQAKAKGVSLRQLPDIGIQHEDAVSIVDNKKLYFLVRNGAYVLEHSERAVWRAYWKVCNIIRELAHGLAGNAVVARALRDRKKI